MACAQLALLTELTLIGAFLLFQRFATFSCVTISLFVGTTILGKSKYCLSYTCHVLKKGEGVLYFDRTLCSSCFQRHQLKTSQPKSNLKYYLTMRQYIVHRRVRCGHLQYFKYLKLLQFLVRDPFFIYYFSSLSYFYSF